MEGCAGAELQNAAELGDGLSRSKICGIVKALTAASDKRMEAAKTRNRAECGGRSGGGGCGGGRAADVKTSNRELRGRGVARGKYADPLPVWETLKLFLK